VSRQHGQTEAGAERPHLAASGYQGVGYWLLNARAKPGVAPAYADAVGALWARCTSTRTLPTPKAFDQSVNVLHDMLAAARAGSQSATDRQELARVARALDRAEAEAVKAGLSHRGHA
jgi:hypothetical protein